MLERHSRPSSLGLGGNDAQQPKFFAIKTALHHISNEMDVTGVIAAQLVNLIGALVVTIRAIAAV